MGQNLKVFTSVFSTAIRKKTSEKSALNHPLTVCSYGFPLLSNLMRTESKKLVSHLCITYGCSVPVADVRISSLSMRQVAFDSVKSCSKTLLARYWTSGPLSMALSFGLFSQASRYRTGLSKTLMVDFEMNV